MTFILNAIFLIYLFSLTDLEEFIKTKDCNLKKEVKEGNYAHLIQMMSNLNDVRERTTKYDGLFEPVKYKIALLKSCEQDVPEDVYEKLQVSFYLYYRQSKITDSDQHDQ